VLAALSRTSPEPNDLMRIRSLAALSLLTLSSASLAACGGGFGDSIGLSKITPDEFLTVSTAPLSLPPEYGLRPPAPGQPRPQELAPESAARQILLGERQSVTRTPGEQLLVAQAGADQADPLARYVIDDEFGDLAHKDENWADRVMFWRRDDSTTQAATTTPGSQGDVTIDASTEAERLRALTGTQTGIVIAPRRSGGIKLPGL